MENKKKVLEEIVRSRRSTRNFMPDSVAEEDLMRILESAVYAPYGGATGMPLREIRKIFVFSRGTDSMSSLERIVQSTINGNAKKIRLIVRLMPFMKKKMGAFAKRLETLSEKGISALKDAPYVIIIAEKKGFPPVEKESIAHAMENMWLAATAAGLGFQLISAISTISGNKEFLELAGLSKGEYSLGGCAIGYPGHSSGKSRNLDIKDFTIWPK